MGWLGSKDPDPFRVGAYVHDGTALYRIAEVDAPSVWLEDCVTEYQQDVLLVELRNSVRRHLVKRAPPARFESD